jgi:hypothetical protein
MCFCACVMKTNDWQRIDWRVLCFSSVYLISMCVLCAYLGRGDTLTLHVLLNGQRKTAGLVNAADLRGGDEERWVGGWGSKR